MSKLQVKNPWIAALIWGLTGGLLVTISRFLPADKTWKNEIAMMITFVICIFGLFYNVRLNKHKRFITVYFASLITWVMMYITPHSMLALKNGGYQNFWWLIPFFQMLGTGMILCAIFTWLTINVRRSSYDTEHIQS